MDQDTVLRQLANISGGLRPGLGATTADLEEVHQLLAPKILQGLYENLIAPGSSISELGTPLEQLASEERDTLQKVLATTETTLAKEPFHKENLHLFRRELPLLTPELPTSVPTWAAGWGVERSLGPFLDASGQPYWFDIRRSLQQVIIRRPDTQDILLTFPQGRVDTDGSLILSAGSVWILAKILASRAPDKGYVGLKIQEGRLTIRGSGTVTGGSIVLSAGTQLTLQLTLAPSIPPSASASRLGLDAQDAVVSLPSSATIVIRIQQTLFDRISVKGEVIASDASTTVYGATCNLTFEEGAAITYNSELDRVLIPYKCSASTFAPTSVQSQLFQPSGQATVSRAAWALPIAVPSTDVSQLGAVEGLGGLLLVLRPGLQATWSGLRSRRTEGVRMIDLAQTFLLIEPGQLLLQAQQAKARDVIQDLQLWQEATTSRRCSIDLEFPQPIAVQFVSSAIADPSEVLALNALVVVTHLDRPISADGQRFTLHSQQGSLIIWEDSIGRFLRLGAHADTLTNGAAPTALALRNLYLKTTQPLSLGLFGKLIGFSEVESGSLRLGFGILAGIPMLPDPYASSWELSYQEDERSFVPGQVVDTNLTALVTWDTPTTPSLQLQLLDLTASDTLANHFTPSVSNNPLREFTRAASIVHTPNVVSVRGRLLSLLGTGTNSGTEAFRLLDVSTNADQFGVSLTTGNRIDLSVNTPSARPTIRGLDFVAPANTVRILTLPAFQWEPIRNIPNPDAGIYPDLVVSDTDGGPTRIGTDTVKLVPVAPIPATAELLTAYNDPQQRQGFSVYPKGPEGVKKSHFLL